MAAMENYSNEWLAYYNCMTTQVRGWIRMCNVPHKQLCWYAYSVASCLL